MPCGFRPRYYHYQHARRTEDSLHLLELNHITKAEKLLDLETPRVIGYMATCSCGWFGPVRSSRVIARDDARTHNTHERDETTQEDVPEIP